MKELKKILENGRCCMSPHVARVALVWLPCYMTQDSESQRKILEMLFNVLTVSYSLSLSITFFYLLPPPHFLSVAVFPCFCSSLAVYIANFSWNTHCTST
jgi:hypothetical protein